MNLAIRAFDIIVHFFLLCRFPDFRGSAKSALRKMCDFDRNLAQLAGQAHLGQDEAKGAVFYDKAVRTKAAVRRLKDCIDSLECGLQLLLGIRQKGELWDKLSPALGCGAAASVDLTAVQDFCDTFRRSYDLNEVIAIFNYYFFTFTSLLSTYILGRGKWYRVANFRDKQLLRTSKVKKDAQSL